MIDKWLGSDLHELMYLLNTYLKDEDSVPLKILDQALGHLHPVHKIPNYSKHPKEKAQSRVRDQTAEKLRQYPQYPQMLWTLTLSAQ